MSTTFRIQDVRLGGNIENKDHKDITIQLEVSVHCTCAIYTLFLLFLFITEDIVYKMASIKVLLQSAYVSLR